MKALKLQQDIEEAYRVRTYVLENGTVLQYIDAVDRLYRALGAPLGPGTAALDLWLRFRVAVTSN